MIKKYMVGLLVACTLPALAAFAATPSLSLSGGSDSNTAIVNVTGGDINSPVVLYYTGTDGTLHSQIIGNTTANGTFSGNLSTNTIGLNGAYPVYVMVNGYSSGNYNWPYSTSNNTSVSFSNANPIVATGGGNGTVTLSGGTGSYYITSNSNTGAINASISGNTLTFNGVRNGSAVVGVCPVGQIYNTATCRTLTLTSSGSVGQGNSTTSNGAVTFSVNNPSVSFGGNGSVTLSGGTGSYYIANNSNNNAVNATISGNTLTYSGVGTGTSVITVCPVSQISANCSYVTVNSGNVNGTNSISFSQSNPNVVIGTPMTIQINGAAAPYTVTPLTGSNVSTQLSGNNLTLNGTALGTATFNVCGSNGVCSILAVNSGTTAPTPTTTASALPFTLSLAANQVVKLNMSASGNANGSFYLQSPVSSPIMASISGNTLTVMGTAFGSATVNVCQNGSSTCIPITFNVDRTDLSATVPVVLTGTGGPFIFTGNLWLGMSGDDVRELQVYLINSGYLNASATGFFGPITLAAVKKYQLAKGLAATGYVGPLTRERLNNGD